LGVPCLDPPTTASPTVGQPEAGFCIANEPEARLFLGQLVTDHKDDHAYQVRASFLNVVPVRADLKSNHLVTKRCLLLPWISGVAAGVLVGPD